MLADVRPDVWNLVHIVTKLELGGAQLATLDEVQHSRFCTGGRFLLAGPGGLLDAEARALAEARFVPIAALGRELSPAADSRALWALWRSLTALRRSRPGERFLVHTHSSKAGVLGRLAARLAGADRVVHSIHGFGYHRLQPPLSRALFRTAERLAARLCDGLTADSAANLEQARQDRVAGARLPTRVIHCGIDVEAFRRPRRPPAEIRAALEIPHGHRVVLNVSCLKPQKDPLAFVELAARVLARAPATTFLLAGDGELRGPVEALGRRLDLGGRLRLLGWRRDVADLLHASDLLVSTSLWEGLPQVFAQAMAAARPIVATGVDGAPEAVRHRDSGLLYPVGDVDGMADGVLELLAQPELAARMGARAVELVPQFSRERMLADLDRFYAEVAAAPRRRRG
ncbi:MAG: glycosyltransferase [Deltaproteobacteria bacterium]|nr:glycosyltransferase [Deltaproteobacteria bacterium]